MINGKDCRLKIFACVFLAASFPVVAGCGNVRVNAPISASASPQGETKSNRQPLSTIFPLYSDYGEPSPLPTVKKHLKVSKLVRDLMSGASGRYRNLSLVVDGEPSIVHLTCGPERHPSDTDKSQTDARFRYKISIDESSFTSDPVSMLEEYYRRIDDGDKKGAFTLRSSSATTSYAEFTETWKSNRTLELRHPSVSSDSTVDCELVSDDFDPESNQVNRRVFSCKIKVTKELGEWRYAGGDFHQVSCVAIKADATADVPSEPLQAQQQTIVIRSDEPADASEEAHRELILEYGVSVAMLQSIEKHFRLPRQLTIRLRKTEGPRACYKPASNEIELGYGLVPYFLDMAPAAQKSDFMAGCLKFAFLHELAHALIHEFNLPIVGREEDAADEFSAILMTAEISSNQCDGVLLWLVKMSEGQTAANFDFGDEHSFNVQRCLNVLRLLVGSKNYNSQLGSLFSEESREKACEDYQKKYEAWEKLLRPYFSL